MKKVHPIILILLIFVLLNVIIVLLWPLRTSLKFSNYKAYSDEFIVSLNLDRKESVKLYLETWQRERLFEYDEFTGLRESVSIDGEYVNIDIENGRLISNNPKNCEKNIFFYGGENVFGYDVGDNQSTPYYFREILKKNDLNYCVFNFGRATYYSTQENILFQKHILNKEIKSGNIVLFLDGINENGNRNSRNTRFLFEVNRALNEDYWDMYKFTFPIFFNSLTINQFIKRVQKKYNLKKSSNQEPTSIFKLTDDLKYVYEKNVLIRDGICNNLSLNCYSFLQPFATLHGKYFEKPTEGAIENRVLNTGENKKLTAKYQILNSTKGIIDIADSLDNAISLSYVDGVHYSPLANEEIANKIYGIILEKLD